MYDIYTKAVAITAGSNPLALKNPKGIYIATDGNISGELAGNPGTSVTFTAVKAGNVYPLRFLKITACPAGTLALY